MDNVEELKKEYELLVTVMCKALNEPKRLLILTLLGERPRTVSDLVEEIGSPQANVSQHLAILRDRGLVKATREGTSVTYSLSHQQILTAIATLREVMHDELDQKRRLLSPDQDPTTAKEAS
ncbi:MAG: ArsR/SmtB family transcription factor [Ferrimicrobium sp.]|uniref:Metalloregulator ArsR/SmtB family transcription factor n=1 Tax=Ferrimicrobium acidiphilum TaxID=121039 RepID=A0ABV3Y259_9ACTN|nr:MULTISPECIES: metalloregulator ArsR/SmtB family transcription factor [Ferrimicrobium]